MRRGCRGQVSSERKSAVECFHPHPNRPSDFDERVKPYSNVSRGRLKWNACDALPTVSRVASGGLECMDRT